MAGVAFRFTSAIHEIAQVLRDVARLAVGGATGAALAWRRARHALAEGKITVEAEWALRLACLTVEELEHALDVTLGAVVAVLLVALSARLMTLLAGEARLVVERRCGALAVAFGIV